MNFKHFFISRKFRVILHNISLKQSGTLNSTHENQRKNTAEYNCDISSNSTEKNLDVASSVPLQPTQLLSRGHGPSSREARLLRLRSKYLEPDSSSRQEPSFCSGFSQRSKDLLDSATIYKLRYRNALSVSLLYIRHYKVHDYAANSFVSVKNLKANKKNCISILKVQQNFRQESF